MSVALIFLVFNFLSALGGWWQSYWRVALNLAVILSLFLRFRHAKLLVKVWAVLPLASFGAFLLLSALRGKWSAYPIEHIVSVALTLPIFLWANKAFSEPAKET
jgi:hypothetical protein